MSALFLTPDELYELTGFKAAHCQARWLDQNRWRYAPDRHNRPKVARDYFNARIGATAANQVNQVNPALMLEQPNFAALDGYRVRA